MIIGQQYEPFVIPCKPTSPKVKVELIKEDGEVIKEISFNETTGFLVVSDEVIESGLMFCDFTLSDIVQQVTFMIQVDRRFPSLLKPSHIFKYLYPERAQLIRSCKKLPLPNQNYIINHRAECKFI